MQMISKDIDLDQEIIKSYLKQSHIEKTCLIDIETTGFDRKRNQIFLIGCIYFTRDGARLIQWLCEKKEDEYELLFRFSQFIKSFQTVLHYNGSSFDIPFIKARLQAYRLPPLPDPLREIDLYTSMRKLQPLLSLENLKLKTVEAFFGYQRSDQLGGELIIDTFNKWMKDPKDFLRDALLFHNEEDILGLYQCLHSFIYTDFFKKSAEQSIKPKNMVLDLQDAWLSLNLTYPVGFRGSLSLPPYTLVLSETSISIFLPIFEGELKLYFKDYYNYFYLPLEDKIIHKSIGQFVDKSFKEKATKENCYIKKRGKYLPLIFGYDTNHKLFSSDYKEKLHFVALTDELENDHDFFQKLFTYVLSRL